MASGGEDLAKKFRDFASLGGKDPNQFTSQAAGKMAVDCWSKKYKNVKTVVDASVYPKVLKEGKEKGGIPKESRTIPIEGGRMHTYCRYVAHELVKNKKGAKTPADDPEVDTVCADLEKLVIDSGPHVKETKTSKTGGVDKMTDASKYTGAHKERFDASGKGKGAAGRADKQEHSGYVGAYKGAGTYDKKK